MKSDYVPVWLSVVGSLGTILTLIVTYFLNRQTAKGVATKVADVAIAAATVATKVDEVAVAAGAVATKVEEVAVAAQSQVAGTARLQETADATHKIVNSRYDEIREELKKSNDNNAKLTMLLAKAGIIAPGGNGSEVLAASPPPKKGK